MFRRCTLLTALALSLCAVPAQAAPATGRLVVHLAPAVGGPGDGPQARAVLAQAGGRLDGPGVPALDVVTTRPASGVSLATLARNLRRHPAVTRVDRERRGEPRGLPNDPALTQLEPAPGAPAGTTRQWWAERQNLPAAWAVRQARGATVAVIDTGVDGRHPDLAGRIVGGADIDPTPGRGPQTVDEEGHGTHVASLACAAQDNAIGIAGAAYGCRLLVYKSDFSDASIAASIVEATDAGADAINMSFGTDGGQAAPAVVRDAITYAHDRGVVLVAAAADEPTERQGYPADLLQPDGTGPLRDRGLGLSVTAANFAGARASFAGSGSQISMAAYGAWNTGSGGPRGVLGAFPADTVGLERSTFGGRPCGCRTSISGDTRYAYVQGTSMAAPMVTGVAAMIGHLNPDLSADTIVELLKQSASRPAGADWNSDLGWGILDAGAAMTVARSLDRRAPATRVRSSSGKGRTRTLRLVGGDRAPSGVTRSGVARFDVYASVDGSRPRRLVRSSRRQVRLRVTPGRRYAFFSRAVDRAGNREPRPRRPDLTLRA